MPDQAVRLERGQTGQRSFSIQARNIDQDARTVEVAFSSDDPIERWWGFEILEHAADAVRLQRLNDGGAVLRNHRSDQHVGVVESARIDSDGKGRALLRFSAEGDGPAVFRDIQDGILRHVSVGYLIHEIVETERKNEPVEIRITDWEPLEVSMVAVPADASVGVGRAIQTGEPKMPKATARDERNTLPPDAGGSDDDNMPSTPATTRADGPAPAAAPAAPVVPATSDADRTAVDAEIRQIGERFGLSETAETLISLGGSADEMRAAARGAAVAAASAPIRAGQGVHVVGDHMSGGVRPRRRRHLVAFKEDGEEVAHRAGMWARAVLFQDSRALQWCNEAGVRVMTTGSIAGGGALVPVEMEQGIIDLREEYGIIRMLSRNVTMSSETRMVARRKGGVTAHFVGQEEATTESEKTWEQVGLVAREISALSRISNSLDEDSEIDLAEDLADEMAYAFSEKEDDCAFNGDGTSTYGGIVGMRTKLIDADHGAGVVTGAAGVDTYAEITSANLDLVRAKLPQFAARGAVWVASKPGKNLVFDPLNSAAGGNTRTELAGRPADSYLGDAIAVSQSMPTATTSLASTVGLLYGDFRKGTTFGDRTGMAVQILTERYAEFRQIGVLGFERFDFNAHDLGDTANAGPVVGFKFGTA